MFLLSNVLQIHCLQFLICELVSGGNLRKPGGLFGNSGSGIPVEDLKQLETFFYKLSFFLHILDYTGTLLSQAGIAILICMQLLLYIWCISWFNTSVIITYNLIYLTRWKIHSVYSHTRMI
jgi:hypothetical protein